MKLITPEGFELEMTTQEFLEIAPGLAKRLQEHTESSKNKEVVLNLKHEEPSILIQRVLLRRPIPKGQQSLFKALFEAKEGGLCQDELANLMGRTIYQLNGVLGALGRRISGTEGSSQGIDLMLKVSKRDGHWHYTMKDDLHDELANGNYTWLSKQ